MLVAASADAEGAHSFARVALLAAVPFAAVVALAAFGECLDGRRDGLATLQAILSGLIVSLLVLSCALRSNAVQGVPHDAVTALLAALVVFAVKGLLAGVPYLGRLSEFWPAKP